MTHFHAVEAFINALHLSGIRHVVVSPGSRSTPLSVYVDRHPDIDVRIIIDERSAAFFALGMAKSLCEPVGLICTSGTAAANYLPAVVEARYSGVPLVFLTADRPPEARDMGAPQTIDQIRLYGEHVKWFVDMPLPEARPDTVRFFETAARRAAAEATTAPAGPVHLNLPLREPLTPPSGSFLKERASHESAYVRPRPLSADPGELAELAQELLQREKGMIICGPQPSGFVAANAVQLAERLRIPILADPLSGVRYGPHRRSHVIDAYDAVLRGDRWKSALKPDYVIRLGALPTSKALTLFLKDQRERHIVVDPHGWNDSILSASQILRADPALFCAELLETVQTLTRHTAPSTGKLAQDGEPVPSDWLTAWQALNRAARSELHQAALEATGMFEGRIFVELGEILPSDAVLFVGNSMPVRDLDAFLGSTHKSLHPMANRGANGIDGVLSTALGSVAGTKSPGALVVGDVSFLHDIGGLLAARACETPFVVIVVNNDGGGIFSFLPQAEDAENFETLFGTPHGLEFSKAAAFYALKYERPQNWRDFRTVIEKALSTAGVTIVELVSSRHENVVAHRRIEARVLAKLRNADTNLRPNTSARSERAKG